MFIFIPETASYMRTRMKRVKCESCDTPFAYQQTYSGSATVFGLSFFSTKKLRQAATIQAAKNARANMHLQADLVPCPCCNWVNQSLIDLYARNKYHYSLSERVIIALTTQLFMMAMLIVFYFKIESLGLFHPDARIWIALSFFASIPGLPLLALLGCASLFKTQVKPNRHWPKGKPVIPMGTPQGQIVMSSINELSTWLDARAQSSQTNER